VKQKPASAPRRYTPEELTSSGSKEVLYRVNPRASGANEFSGLFDTELKILSPKDPRYSQFAEIFELEEKTRSLKGKDKYVLVLLRRGSTWSSPTIVKLSMLVEK